MLQPPKAPVGLYSPPSVAFDAPLDSSGGRSRDPTKRHPIPAPPPRIQLVKKRPTVERRTREEEKTAFGKVFEGCGIKSDYEMTTKLGEGTFGEVHKAIQKSTGRAVALKRILMHNEKEGMPVTALREIKILKALKHECVIELLDMFIVHSNEVDPMSVYMVFPYMDHDLAGLLENERVKLTPSQIKLYMKQLLEGTEYMHQNNILHRDMKAANLLISNTGSLRIADFGLARAFDSQEYKTAPERKYTNCVVTRWYRPPELLLGARNYGGEVDIWGIGCVFGEMFNRSPILPGNSDIDQLDRIWGLCGTPNQHSWPNYDALPGCEGMVKRNPAPLPRKVKKAWESVGAETVDLLDKLLICNPQERITATQALEHDYFWTDPLPADPKRCDFRDSGFLFDSMLNALH
ncbi:kinase-like domain-containing protein [Rhodocollybia butyracea]|uniref:Kinase-like domain-containing protein n=1 Tax=Rhodocollybia butyracea TaxID=206335 RepID=A0A9P5U842_9AGAR|nr:kinase-like domain-containing protein [Rhodocollybia butyracea]